MKTHNLTQGSTEWHAYRSQHFNASDAPAMMGCSAYKTRTQLLHELATSHAPDVDAATQRRFDEGHRIEALARPLAEKIIGEDLYPVVGSNGNLSASFDGLTMAEDTAFEHKTLNDELRAAMTDEGNGYGLPLQYQVQMEQQLLVSGADRVLFMATKWDGDELVEQRKCWYASDRNLRAKIVAGWEQFRSDLAAYVPQEATVAPVAAPQMGLPAVSITVNGSIALVDNLDKFGAALTAYVARINKSPESDQDFADLEATVKTLKTAEEALDAAESNALAQTDSIDAMRRTVALYRDTARTNRLLIEKLVKAEKETRRIHIVNYACVELADHVRKLNSRIGAGYMPTIASDFHGVIKGLKSLDSMKDKVDGELARCKIEANAIADRIQENLETPGLHGYSFLFADLATICTKATDDFQNTVTARITAHEAAQAAKEEATRERIRAEEQARAEREHAAMVELERMNREHIEKAQAARIREEQAAELTLATAPPCHQTVVPAVVRQATKPATTPTLRIGEIANRLGFGITAAFLRTMDFEPAGKEGASVLYYETDFPAICQALIEHITEVSEQFDAVSA